MTLLAAAAKSLQSCPTLCNPTDGSPPGSLVPGILQARTLEWVAISFSNAWTWKVKVKSLSRVRLFVTPWTAAHQAPPSMGFSRQEHWSGVPLPSPWLSLGLIICIKWLTKLKKTIYYYYFIIKDTTLYHATFAQAAPKYGERGTELLPSGKATLSAPVFIRWDALRIALFKSFYRSPVSLPSSQKLMGKAENFNGLITWSFWWPVPSEDLRIPSKPPH